MTAYPILDLYTHVVETQVLVQAHLNLATSARSLADTTERQDLWNVGHKLRAATLQATQDSKSAMKAVIKASTAQSLISIQTDLAGLSTKISQTGMFDAKDPEKPGSVPAATPTIRDMWDVISASSTTLGTLRERIHQALVTHLDAMASPPPTVVYDPPPEPRFTPYDGSDKSTWNSFKFGIKVYISAYWASFATVGQIQVLMINSFAGPVLTWYLTTNPPTETHTISSADDALRVVTAALDVVAPLYGESVAETRARGRVQFRKTYQSTRDGRKTRSFQQFLLEFLGAAQDAGYITYWPDAKHPPNQYVFDELRFRMHADLLEAVDTALGGHTDDWQQFVTVCRRIDEIRSLYK